MVQRRVIGVLLAASCGFFNPLGETRDGRAPRTRLRIGIASATVGEDCGEPGACSVQVEMGHFDGEAVHVEVVAVRLIASGVDLGAVPNGEPLRWRRGEYRGWDHVVETSRSTKLSIPIGAIEWQKLLAPLPGEPNPHAQEYGVEVDVVVDGEPLTAESIFTVAARSPRVFMVT